MEGKYSEEEILFIKEVLDQHGEYLSEILADDLKKKKLRDKGKLLAQFQDGMPYSVEQTGLNPKLLFNFFGYGRAIEINWHKSKNAKKFSASKDIWGIRKRKRRKNTKWYTHNVMGSLNRLTGILGSEYTEHERKRIKNILDNQKARIAL